MTEYQKGFSDLSKVIVILEVEFIIMKDLNFNMNKAGRGWMVAQGRIWWAGLDIHTNGHIQLIPKNYSSHILSLNWTNPVSTAKNIAEICAIFHRNILYYIKAVQKIPHIFAQAFAHHWKFRKKYRKLLREYTVIIAVRKYYRKQIANICGLPKKNANASKKGGKYLGLLSL